MRELGAEVCPLGAGCPCARCGMRGRNLPAGRDGSGDAPGGAARGQRGPVGMGWGRSCAAPAPVLSVSLCLSPRFDKRGGNIGADGVVPAGGRAAAARRGGSQLGDASSSITVHNEYPNPAFIQCLSSRRVPGRAASIKEQLRALFIAPKPLWAVRPWGTTAEPQGVGDARPRHRRAGPRSAGTRCGQSLVLERSGSSLPVLYRCKLICISSASRRNRCWGGEGNAAAAALSVSSGALCVPERC